MISKLYLINFIIASILVKLNKISKWDLNNPKSTKITFVNNLNSRKEITKLKV